MGDRRLTAILVADIAGYSALMGADEVGALSSLKGSEAVVLPMVSAFGGRIIDTAGDGLLARFPSALNAVKCAVAVQDVMLERNAAVRPDWRMQYRIGINQGDVLFDQDRIYGDAVNVAARLEGICAPGGICISGKVFDEVKGRLEIQYEDIGEQRLKNIAAPVRVYRIGVSAAVPDGSKSSRRAWLPRNMRTTTAVVSIALGASLGWSTLSANKSPEPSWPTVRPFPAIATHEVPPRIPFVSARTAVEPERERSSLQHVTDTGTHIAGTPPSQEWPGTPQAVPHRHDGTWEFVLSGGTYCPVKRRTFRLVAQGGTVVSPRGQNLGTVDLDGTIRFSAPTPVVPGVMVEFHGRLVGDVGSGTYRSVLGLCEGTYRVELVERL